jgi:hypothetical protein
LSIDPSLRRVSKLLGILPRGGQAQRAGSVGNAGNSLRGQGSSAGRKGQCCQLAEISAHYSPKQALEFVEKFAIELALFRSIILHFCPPAICLGKNAIFFIKGHIFFELAGKFC